MALTFIDLFAGIGGFHQALSQLGMSCIFASEMDTKAQSVYSLNHHSTLSGPLVGDIVPLSDSRVDPIIPPHDVLTAGFPCQPFSKSGAQAGIEETRGTLFFNIARIIEERRPLLVVLENVRNLAGPRHESTWALIHSILGNLGYHVNVKPVVVSPHRLAPEFGGTPQFRERVFIVAIRSGGRAVRPHALPEIIQNRPTRGWSPSNWNFQRHAVLPRRQIHRPSQYELSEADVAIIDAWQEFATDVRQQDGRQLPGFPLWTDYWNESRSIPADTPGWKLALIRKNQEFAQQNEKTIRRWKRGHKNVIETATPSRLKFEWQAQDMLSAWDGLIQLRPSGIRVKLPTYSPALVALSQTPIIGWKRRRLSVEEAAGLQGLSPTFDFGNQPESESYKQLGNAVSVGVVRTLLIQLALREPLLPQVVAKQILDGAQQAGYLLDEIRH